jgi:hypothetical protein
MHPAKIAHAVLTRRQHMLQITPHELVGRERALTPFLGLRIGVLEGHRIIVDRDDAFVADRSF